MTTAWIEGQPVSSGEAIREAASVLSASRLPLVTGYFDDISALREAARVAGASGGVLDHMDLASVAPLIEALRENGMIRVSPGEMRRRADRVLVIGSDPFAGSEAVFEQIFSVYPDLGANTKGGPREIMLLGADAPGRFSEAKGNVRTIACPADELGDAVGIVRAALGGKPFEDGPFEEGAARALAGWLKDAGFAAIVFDASELDSIAIEGIAGLVADLNGETRCSALPLTAGSGYGAAEAAIWTTGFPLRTAFGRGDPEHDMALNEGGRLLASGEADAQLVLSYDDGALHDTGVPTVLLSTAEEPAGDGARVVFRIGRPGIDHAMVHHEPRFGSFVSKAAEHSGMTTNAADILSAIADQLGKAQHSNDEARA